VSTLVQRLVAIHDSLSAAGLPHAMGGAIAYGFCVPEPRGTRDLDVNIFVTSDRAAEAFAALPFEVSPRGRRLELAERDGQVRLWWDDTPVDVFLNNLPVHDAAAKNIRHVPFAGRRIPVLGCTDLAVFKAMFDRPRDWVDIEAMVDVDAVEIDDAVYWLQELDNPAGAERISKLAAASGERA
jgi:hypothetical protein